MYRQERENDIKLNSVKKAVVHLHRRFTTCWSPARDIFYCVPKMLVLWNRLRVLKKRDDCIDSPLLLLDEIPEIPTGSFISLYWNYVRWFTFNRRYASYLNVALPYLGLSGCIFYYVDICNRACEVLKLDKHYLLLNRLLTLKKVTTVLKSVCVC